MSEPEAKSEHQTKTIVENVILVITEELTELSEKVPENSDGKSDSKSAEQKSKKEPEVVEEIADKSTTSILSDGTVTTTKRTQKKSVSFDPEDENNVKKFIEGDVIVDKQNPFKNGDITVDKVIVAKPRRLSKPKVSNESEFVTTEDVLRESKYVTTYIKNPDKVFKYDPTVIARLTLEDLKEIQAKKPMRKKILSKQTQERLKEVKSKYHSSNPSIYSAKPVKLSSKELSSSDTKIPKYKKVTKSNYPDLSQIKVKTGTDLDESFELNPEEVVLNAKRFDDRVKSLKIGSDDELEEIEEPLTNVPDNNNESNGKDQIDSGQKPDESKKSFTNTVNSNEFREYLNKKGLVLFPKEKLLNGNAKSIKEEEESVEYITNSTASMDSKKDKKPSVLHRIFRPNLFSSKRKTTPKDPVPTPQSVYSNTIETSKPANSVKRVVLERQSFHGAPINNNFTTNDLRKQIEQTRKSYGGDDRSSSISSALTNAEDFPDNHSVDSIRQSEPPRIELQPVKPRVPARPRERSKESIPVKVTAAKGSDRSKEASLRPEPITQKPIPAIRRTVERQSLIERKPLFSASDDGRNFRRTVSLERQEISRRTQIPVKSSLNSSRPVRREPQANKSLSIPRSSKENEASRMTSTPIARQSITPVTPVPIKPAPLSTSSINVSTTEWNKLRELKERTDNELYLKSSVPQAERPPRPVVRQPECIYETVPINQPKGKILISREGEAMYASNVALNPNFVRGSPQRNTYSGGGYSNFKAPEENLRSRPPQGLPAEVTIETQPHRSQSVMDDMLVPQQQHFVRAGNTPVILRKKPGTGPLSKEEIMSRVRDFCRRSMNKTPTKGDHQEIKTQADVSPVSYASVNVQRGNTPQILAPQVPQRVHSLGRQPTAVSTASPIYAHVVKRGSLQSNASDVYYSPMRKTAGHISQTQLPQGSDTDSVFLPVSQQPASPGSNVSYRTRSGSEVYAQSPYALVPIRPPIMPKPRIAADGRSTPLVLMEPRLNPSPIYSNTAAQPQHRVYPNPPRSVTLPANNNGVHMRVNEQIYRPASALGMVPVRPQQMYPQQQQQMFQQHSPRRVIHFYESESGSEAGEIQRIMRSKEEDWQNEKSGRNQSNDQATDDRRRANRREDPRRHTLGSDMLQYAGQGQPQQRAVDLEVNYVSYASLV